MKVVAVALDDTQQYFRLPPEIVSVHTVYAYTPDKCTHLCELTPSYDLRFLYSYIVCTDDTPDERRGELTEEFCMSGADEDTYMHCGSVERLTTRKDCGEFETLEEALEHLQGNWPL